MHETLLDALYIYQISKSFFGINTPSILPTKESQHFKKKKKKKKKEELYWSTVDLKCCISFSYTVKVNRLYIYVYPFFSRTGYYKLLSRFPCAIHYVLINYFIQWCVYAIPIFIMNPSPPKFPRW